MKISISGILRIPISSIFLDEDIYPRKAIAPSTLAFINADWRNFQNKPADEERYGAVTYRSA